MIKYKVTKIEANMPERTITLSDWDLEVIYNALNEYQDPHQDEDDNDASVIMNKLYELCGV